jgi:hypothetical protein
VLKGSILDQKTYGVPAHLAGAMRGAEGIAYSGLFDEHLDFVMPFYEFREDRDMDSGSHALYRRVGSRKPVPGALE